MRISNRPKGEHNTPPVQVDNTILLSRLYEGIYRSDALTDAAMLSRCPFSGARATEPTVGITHFLSQSDTSFSGVLKQRYSDFIVHEVRLSAYDIIRYAVIRYDMM